MVKRRYRVLYILSLAVLCWTVPASGKVYLMKDEALKQAFPMAEKVERRTLFLSEEEVKRIEDISKTRMESKMFSYYVAIRNNEISGYAFLGSHIVRTKPVVYLIVINPEGSLRQVEVLAFYEPDEYLPSRRWFSQFEGRVLDDGLFPKRGISAVSGATLSVNGITAEVRKVLAIFEIKIQKGGVIR